MPATLSIEGKTFAYLGGQRSGAHVYRGPGCYLRIGARDSIVQHRAHHREMESAQYPVAAIIAEGERDGMSYFIEESLGRISFRAAFEEDYRRQGRVDHRYFAAFTNIAQRLYAAQLKAQRTWSVEEFAIGVDVMALVRELPAYRRDIELTFAAAAKRLQKLPGARLHGDCNPANMYEAGIIDLEDSFVGPVGYDQISALMTIEWSPDTKDFEFFAQYTFSDAQKASYLKALNVLGKKAGIPDLRIYADDLALCRAIWLCRGMAPWPRIQQWRYEKFIAKYLSNHS